MLHHFPPTQSRPARPSGVGPKLGRSAGHSRPVPQTRTESEPLPVVQLRQQILGHARLSTTQEHPRVSLTGLRTVYDRSHADA